MSIVVLASFPVSYEIEPFSVCFLSPENAQKLPFFGQKMPFPGPGEAFFMAGRCLLVSSRSVLDSLRSVLVLFWNVLTAAKGVVLPVFALPFF